MATNGFDSTTGALVIAAINGGTAFTVTGPFKCLFNSATRTADNGADTEWVSGGGYTPGTGFSGLTFAAATTDATGAHQASNVIVTLANILNNTTWHGNTVKDSSTPKATWWAALASPKTVNSGDTVTVPSGSFTTNMG